MKFINEYCDTHTPTPTHRHVDTDKQLDNLHTPNIYILSTALQRLAAIKEFKADITTELQYHVFLGHLLKALKDKHAFSVPSPLISTSSHVSFPQDNYLFKKFAKASSTSSKDSSNNNARRRLKLPIDHASTYMYILSSLREVSENYVSLLRMQPPSFNPPSRFGPHSSAKTTSPIP